MAIRVGEIKWLMNIKMTRIFIRLLKKIIVRNSETFFFIISYL